MLKQQGMGLLEVLIALLLLAVAVLGFSAMQMRAIQATDETLVRSDAMVIIRNLSEDLRHYPTSDQKQRYINAISSSNTTTINCNTSQCNEEQQVNYNVRQAIKLAEESGIKLNAQSCNTGAREINKVCLIASWDATEPKMADETNACADAEGTYKPNTSCIIMETY